MLGRKTAHHLSACEKCSQMEVVGLVRTSKAHWVISDAHRQPMLSQPAEARHIAALIRDQPLEYSEGIDFEPGGHTLCCLRASNGGTVHGLGRGGLRQQLGSSRRSQQQCSRPDLQSPA